MRRFVTLVSLVVVFSFGISKLVEAKKIVVADENLKVYKVRRGLFQDVILKSFTVKKDTRITKAKYVSEEGGWALSTNNFHSGKYVYYFSTTNHWYTDSNKFVGMTEQMAPLQWRAKKNVWVWSKPGSGRKKFNLYKYKNKTWTSERATQLYYNKNIDYLWIRSGKLSGWVLYNSLKLAPYRIYNVEGRHAEVPATTPTEV